MGYWWNFLKHLSSWCLLFVVPTLDPIDHCECFPPRVWGGRFRETPKPFPQVPRLKSEGDIPVVVQQKQQATSTCCNYHGQSTVVLRACCWISPIQSFANIMTESYEDYERVRRVCFLLELFPCFVDGSWWVINCECFYRNAFAWLINTKSMANSPCWLL